MASRHSRTRRLFAVMCFGVALSTGSALRAQEVKEPAVTSARCLGTLFKTVPAFAAPEPTFSAATFRMPAPTPSFSIPAPTFSVPAFNALEPRPGDVTDSATGQRDVSWALLPSNFLDDQRAMWLFPAQLAHGHHWLPTISIVGVTAGLIVADPHDAPYFRRTNSFQEFNSAFSGTASAAGIVAVPVLAYVVGLVRKDSYTQKTALFAGEAAADSFVLYAATDLATHRLRPSDIAPQGNFSDTFYDGHRAVLANSFPSGHTTEAFAIATIFARRYRKHRWVPFLAYGAASVIAFSRITLQSHFPSDVFLGAALGYTVARYDVLRGQ